MTTTFTYNFYQLSNFFVPNEFAYPGFYIVYGNCPLKTPQSSVTSRYSMNIETIINGAGFYETYTITTADDTTNTTIGVLSWIFEYEQSDLATVVSQTLNKSLSGTVTTGSGQYQSLLNAMVTVTYDNSSGDRLITVTPS